MDSDQLCIPLVKYQKGWIVLPRKRGTGRYGNVRDACRKEKCTYVMKIIPFNERYSEKDFNKELAIQQKLYRFGMALKVTDYWTCNNKGVIIMKALDITLKDFLTKKLTEKDIDTISRYVKGLLKKLHTIGYYHGDNHFDNIMLQKVKSDDSHIHTSQGSYKLYFIDFGKSGKLTEQNAKKRIRIDNLIFDTEMKQASMPYKSEFETMMI